MAAADDRKKPPEPCADAASSVPNPLPSPGVSIPRLLWLLIEGGYRDLARAVARYHGIPFPGTGLPDAARRDDPLDRTKGPLDAQ